MCLFVRYSKIGRGPDSDEIMDMLLNAGVTMDTEDRSAVMLAIEAHLYDEVDFFISRGCDVNKKYYDYSEHLLITATAVYDNNIVELLLYNGADIEAKMDNGITSLHAACMDNQVELINLLIRKGAGICVEDIEGKSPFSFIKSEEDNYEESIQVMVKEFAKMTFDNISVSNKDMNLIHGNPVAREYFHVNKKVLYNSYVPLCTQDV